MALLRLPEQQFAAELVVFDKDGLLFDSQFFWRKLAQTRLGAIVERAGTEAALEWCRTFGVEERDGRVAFVDPNGIFALAPPAEEVVVTASVLKRAGRRDWGECRKLAAELFASTDETFDLLDALAPKPGFPDIFRRLREASVPYGIATSDDYDRTKRSIERYDRFDRLDFVVTPVDVKRGKPHPDMLDLIASRTGIAPGGIAMIGDSHVDMQMAREAGCIGIGIPDDPDMERKMRPYASAIISSLDDIVIEP